MNRFRSSKLAWTVLVAFAFTAVGVTQIKQILKVGGTLAVIKMFGKDINKSFNKLWGRDEGPGLKTKIVPIVSIGNGAAIGMAQVMGPPAQVDKVAVVAQPELKFLGELRLRALIPVASEKNLSNLKIVDEVGVSGIVDIKL